MLPEACIPETGEVIRACFSVLCLQALGGMFDDLAHVSVQVSGRDHTESHSANPGNDT